MTGKWVGSTRRARLPKDWAKRVAATKARAHGRCEGVSIKGEQRWHVDGCDGIGAECDHDKRGDDHSLSNLRWLSTPCHTEKTKLEQPRRLRSSRTHPSDA